MRIFVFWFWSLYSSSVSPSIANIFYLGHLYNSKGSTQGEYQITQISLKEVAGINIVGGKTP